MIDVAKAKSLLAALPLAHKAVIVAAGVLVVLAAAAFFRWVTQPTYTMLYADLDPATVSEVVDQLDAMGVDHELEGQSVRVPQEDVHHVRAELAGEGIAATPEVPGYELMDEQGLSVSEFRQEVDFQRALEGELTRTLQAMRDVDEASVHLSIPDEEVFAEQQDPVTASVMLGTPTELAPDTVEAVAFTVASGVEGLEADEVTVTDTEGRTLHSPEVAGTSAGTTSRQMRQTREFEEALAGDVEEMLATMSGDDRASVVVRAGLDYDEREVETETHDPDSQVALREQESQERYAGTNITPGGAVGLDGGPVEEMEGEVDYEREDRTTEFGVDRVVERVTSAPGGVEQLSVAVVMDDGTATGTDLPPVAEVEDLLVAALGMDEERGDDLAVTTMPFPAVDDDAPAEVAETPWWSEQLPLLVAAAVIVAITVALLLMARRRQANSEEVLQWDLVADSDRRYAPTEQLASGRESAGLDSGSAGQGAGVGAADGADGSRVLQTTGTRRLSDEVGDLVEQQPEEIAQLLRSWLADGS